MKCATMLALIAVLQGAAAQGPAEWIWSRADAREDEVVLFRASFEIERNRAAKLVISCDNHFVAWLNGVEVGRGDRWEVPEEIRLRLKHGRNVLAIEGRNDGGPAALTARVDLIGPDTRTLAATDATWRVASPPVEGWIAAEFDDSAWKRAHSFGPTSSPRGPWRDVLARREATSAESLKVPEGFTAELLRSAQPGEGSWSCLTFDDAGRIIVSPERGKLLRVTLDDGDTTVERIEAPVHSAQGLLYAFDALYVCVSRPVKQGGGLWRLRDKDGDGTFEECEQLKEFGNGGEHGAHAIRKGPDGYLYMVHGNMAELPKDIAPDSRHRGYAEDHLLPRAVDPRGHAVRVRAPGSRVFRVDRDGKSWEMVAAGMRNAYDIAFDPAGELFTFDSDMEWDIGLPWYRPTRIIHVVSGGEYGWRTGSSKWPTGYPDSLPASVDIGLSSPTGVEFGTESRFPGPYGSALFAGDWAYGRILAVHLEADGSSYRGTFEVFASGKPLNVTDLVFGPDGALYFTTGGRGTQSGLYRIRANQPTEPQLAEVAPATTALREWRHDLETMHVGPTPGATARLWPALGSTDRFIRYAARLALERQDVGAWRAKALAEKHTDRALSALLALARSGVAADRDPLLERLGALWEGELDARQQIEALRIHALAFIRMGAPDDDLAARTRARLLPRFPTGDATLDRELAALLIYLRTPDIVGRVLDALEAEKNPTEQLFLAFLLRDVADGWSDEHRDRYYAWLAAARRLSGGESFAGYLGTIERANLATMNEDDRAWFAAQIAEASAPPALAKSAPTSTYREWKMNDLQPSLDEVGKGRDFERGKTAFLRSCHVCHRVAGQGGIVGPDLTGVAGRMSRRDMLEAIVMPSRVISDQYKSEMITRRNGEIVVGRVVEEDEKKVTVTDPLGTVRTTIPKSEIDTRRTHSASSMPAGLINVLGREEILDLLAFIEAGGDRKQPAFR